MTHIPVFIEPTQPEVFYCTAQTFAGSMYVDPSPAEWCENEVAEEGATCHLHDACCTGPRNTRCEDCQ